jgi:threonine-phosphate decarboxylase
LVVLPGVRVWPPTANYVFVETAHATELKDHADRHRVLIRDCGGWPGFPFNGVRVAVRRRWENEILVALFQEGLCAG